MASINGIELKNIKKFLGHEQEPCYQGNLYLGGKKISFWSQDSWGAIMDNVDMEKGYSETSLRKNIISLNKDKAVHGTSRDGESFTIDYDLENLMYDLVNLKDYEKRFNSVVKNGYGAIAVIDGGYEASIISLPKSYLAMSDEDLRNHKDMQIYIEKQSKHLRENEKIKFTVFRNSADFNVGTPIPLKDIKLEKKPLEKE